MAMIKKKGLPTDIKLPERIMLENGTMFVTLKTLAEYAKFWLVHKHQFQYACVGIGFGPGTLNTFLNDDQWVFGNSKAAVVETAMRWNEVGISCEFFHYAKESPSEYVGYKNAVDFQKAEAVLAGSWTADDERLYQIRVSESYGWWRLNNLPGGYDDDNWFVGELPELADLNMPIGEVIKSLQEATFDDWGTESDSELRFMDNKAEDSIDADLEYWLAEKREGRETYGAAD